MKKYLLMILTLAAGLLAAKTYTLDNLLEAGLQSSLAMRQKSIMLKNADLSLQNAAWDLLPAVDLAYSRTNTDENYSSRASLVASKTLTLNEPTLFSYKQAKLDKTIAKLDWQQAKKELVYGIFTAWLDLAQLRKDMDIREANLAVLRRIKEQTLLQQQLGQRTSYDVNQSDINVINAELAIAELNNQFTAARAELFNKVKLADDGSPLDFGDYSGPVSPDFEQAQAEPILITKLKQETRQAWLAKLQQKIGLLPTVTFSASYGEYNPGDRLPGDNSPVDVLRLDDYDDSYTLSLGVRWSLWDPFTKANGYARVSNSYKLAQWQYDEEEASLALDKANLRREWNYLSETLALNNRKAAQAADNLRIAQERYNLGTLSLIELEQARVSSLEAELAANRLNYQLQKKAQEWNLLNSNPILDKY